MGVTIIPNAAPVEWNGVLTVDLTARGGSSIAIKSQIERRPQRLISAKPPNHLQLTASTSGYCVYIHVHISISLPSIY